MVLTSKQKEDLNQAILEYLLRNNFKQSAAIFQEETAVDASSLMAETKSHKRDVLENKWTIIAKQTKKLSDLNHKMKQLQEDA